MHKISRRNFLMTCGKTAGGLAAMTAFGGCASPEQAENGLFGSPSALPVKTDDRLAGIDAIVQDYMNQGYFPGAVIAVVRGGKIVYQKAYGYAMLNDMGVRLDDPRPMEQDTLFDMASCTKIMATPKYIGTRKTLSDTGATAAEYFGMPAPQNGTSFLKLLRT